MSFCSQFCTFPCFDWLLDGSLSNLTVLTLSMRKNDGIFLRFLRILKILPSWDVPYFPLLGLRSFLMSTCRNSFFLSHLLSKLVLLLNKIRFWLIYDQYLMLVLLRVLLRLFSRWLVSRWWLFYIIGLIINGYKKLLFRCKYFFFVQILFLDCLLCT